MKRICGLLFSLCLLLGLCACGGQKAETTWQEQYDLGVKYLSEGNYEEAIIAFTAAIEIEPKRAESYIGLANAYTELGETDAAKRALEDGLAATGDADIQAALDLLSVSAEDPAPEDEVEYPEQSGTVVSGALELSGLTYTYTSGGSMAERNEGAVGGLSISATVNGPVGLSDVWIADWYDALPDEETLRSDVAMMVDMWAFTGDVRAVPFDFQNSRPVYPEDRGHTQYVLLIGLNGAGEAAAYAVVEVEIPD